MSSEARAEQDRESLVDMRGYLHVMRRRWMVIVGLLVATLGIALFVTERATPQYSSTAQLFITTPGSDSTDAYQGGLFSQQRVASYADLVQGKNLAQRVVDTLGLSESATRL